MEALRVTSGWGSHTFRPSANRQRQGCQPYVPAAFHTQEDSWYSFLLEAELTPGQLKGLGKLKKSTSSRTWTSNLLACSIVPQPTSSGIILSACSELLHHTIVYLHLHLIVPNYKGLLWDISWSLQRMNFGEHPTDSHWTDNCDLI
jgi:hypothetical protein